MLVNPVSDESDAVLFFVGKRVFLSVVWIILIPCQQVVFEPWNKFLIDVSYASRFWDVLTFIQGLLSCSCTHA